MEENTTTQITADTQTPVSQPVNAPVAAKSNKTLWIVLAVVGGILFVLCGCCCASIIADPEFQEGFQQGYEEGRNAR